ncbi:CpsB/CapC family capsule biosynthesis tyrosine phosphatase [Bacillus sp. DTU_2020_1000418_1_SI_GHA_SEK_038]|uniref:tyrosine-protein phosphatase n=1 Tax=Bacillus sp. DTU_2020_1000418_1_SI_GHA_SEK_038 TaxID=3077585 RepID=UPI0028E4521E|nr:CpsB/CapC family capsule biosynthesis tyrosine phosphatase [Bacillus sp. DTU_2020_1000418_1_SI_GHA_SEK_038]WNS74829.1 CpsB/CapC family capsule biosynthesis tyrosine phosphatase [Bacillus sp. DTU_2020_1000418_1_SI_GHA_SEK_038]
MIDIHCHILPGVDDGAKEYIESIGMAKHAASKGIRTIFATPHHKNGWHNNKAKGILARVNKLNKKLKRRKIPIEILPGQEPRIYGELVEDYKAGKILTLNNQHKYLLIELPDSHVPAYAGELLFNLQLEGITPIIVHPERNVQIRKNPDILYRFVMNGSATQITASSLLGEKGRTFKRFSKQLIKHHLTHFIASDSHRLSRNAFKLPEAYEFINREFGKDYVHIFQENARSILNGNEIIRENPSEIKTRRWFGF